MKCDEVVKWDVEHGTRVEIELEGAYRGGQHSVDDYIRQISLANPHAEIVYVPPKAEEHGASHTFQRVTDELPPETAEIQPHPHGVELGVLMQMFRDTTARNLRSCLANDFCRVSSRTALEICKTRGRVREPAPVGDRARGGGEGPRRDPGHEDHGAADGLHRADRRGADRARAARRGAGRLLRGGVAARRRSTAAIRS